MGFRVPGKVAKRLVEVGQTVDVGQPLATLDEVDLKLQAEQAEAEFSAATGVLAQAGRGRAARQGFARQGLGHRCRRSTAPRPPATRRARGSIAPSARSISPRTRCPMPRWKPTPAASSPRPWSSRARWWRPGRPRSASRASPKRKPWLRSPKRCWAAPRTASPRVSLWSEPGKKYAAKLREVAPSADPATRTYLAKFSLPGADDHVSLGMTATLTLADPATERVARLPLSALFSEGGESLALCRRRMPARSR